MASRQFVNSQLGVRLLHALQEMPQNANDPPFPRLHGNLAYGYPGLDIPAPVLSTSIGPTVVK